MIIPIFLKFFMSITVVFDLVWDLFNMLQIVASIRNIIVSDRNINGNLMIPPCIVLLLEAVNFAVNFKPLENQIVKDKIKEYKQYDIINTATNFIQECGLIFPVMIAFLLVIGFLFAAKILLSKFEKAKLAIEGALNKLMWGTIIRCLLQGYLQMAV